jgi:hypothetical protein
MGWVEMTKVNAKSLHQPLRRSLVGLPGSIPAVLLSFIVLLAPVLAPVQIEPPSTDAHHDLHAHHATDHHPDESAPSHQGHAPHCLVCVLGHWLTPLPTPIVAFTAVYLGIITLLLSAIIRLFTDPNTRCRAPPGLPYRQTTSLTIV